jgi:DNA-directed RNA polymerase subunit RPC12/RpoP
MEIKAYECTQCGSTEYEQAGPKRVRCVHCGSLFQVLTDEPTLVINKGANVVFGKTANVEIRGDLDIEDGAKVNIEGKVTVLKGNQQREFKLKLINDES